jgi:hypothetical protein
MNKFNQDIINIICQYVCEDYKLIDLIDCEYICDYTKLQKNPNPYALIVFLDLIKQYDYFNVFGFRITNPITINAILNYKNKQNIELIDKYHKIYISYIDWNALSSNSDDLALELLINNPNKINYLNLSSNKNIKASILIKDAFMKNLFLLNDNILSNNDSKVNIDISISQVILPENKFRFIYHNIFSMSNDDQFIKYMFKYVNDNKHYQPELIFVHMFNNVNDNIILLLKDLYNFFKCEVFRKAAINMLCSNTNVNALNLMLSLINNNMNDNKINWDRLSSNINAIKICENNLNKVNWYKLCQNANGLDIIKKILYKNPDDKRLKWNLILKNDNENIYDILSYKLDIDNEFRELNWVDVAISTNKGVLKLLRDVYNNNPNDIKIKWNFLCKNKSFEALDMIREKLLNNNNFNNSDYFRNIMSLLIYDLCENENDIAIDIISILMKKNLSVFFDNYNKMMPIIKLIKNSNDRAIDLIDEYWKKIFDRIDTFLLFNLTKNRNKRVINLIEKHMNVDNSKKFYVSLYLLEFNYNVLEYDLEKMKQNRTELNKLLLEV